MKSTFLKFFTLLITLQLIPNESQFAQSSKKQFELSPYIKLNSYSWKEFDDNGKTDLTESGFLFGFGTKGQYSLTKKKNIFIESDIKLFFGKVNYDGFLMLQGGGTQPYSNKTGYFGIEWISNFIYSIPASKEFVFLPTAGLGIEYWTRDLDDGGQYGYDEVYTVFLFNLNAEGQYKVSKNIIMCSSIGIKIPLSISENVDGTSRGNTNINDVNLSPGINPRFSIDVGAKLYNFLATLFFETWTLSKSPIDKNFLQPESTRKWFGLKLGYAFSF